MLVKSELLLLLFSEDADLWSCVTAKLCLDCLLCHMENHMANGQCAS